MNENIMLAVEFRRWIDENRDRLATDAVLITDKLPTLRNNDQSNGCVGLSREHILVSFAAWDRKPIPVELIVYNTRINKTVIMNDFDVSTAGDVLNELDAVANSLASGKYDDMGVDPALSIS